MPDYITQLNLLSQKWGEEGQVIYHLRHNQNVHHPAFMASLNYHQIEVKSDWQGNKRAAKMEAAERWWHIYKQHKADKKKKNVEIIALDKELKLIPQETDMQWYRQTVVLVGRVIKQYLLVVKTSPSDTDWESKIVKCSHDKLIKAECQISTREVILSFTFSDVIDYNQFWHNIC